MARDPKTEIKTDLSRRMMWRDYHKITDTVFPLTMRRIFDDSSEHEKHSIGTGFGIFSYSHRCWFLVTNFHCLSGMDLDGGQIGSFFPNFVDIEFRFSTPSEREGFVLISSCKFRYRLLDGGENANFFHLASEAESNLRGDLAILPIKMPDQVPDVGGSRIHRDHNAFGFLDSQPHINVTDECFVVGYPRGMRGDGRVPIWKRASIASEPNNTYAGDNKFLLDTATREGMSGSPVILRKGTYKVLTEVPSRVELEHEDYLMGVYSGRIGEDELGVQLGCVWPVDLLRYLLARIPEDPLVAEPSFVYD
ncbi:trypsin-like peptidase domain-containing protein [Ovoidimarina sediminis]|uniref:trypsin-like peptidase domain-containing protein n=1 Tax=Ovoidimarina sediminis TaxID=3079856 RepID=UPI0029110487|nr:trypsin-like peptidase domain-containing protein [Rhodophyticola sp. MJ-SS7]MDU8942812.1 trypsin-like peptidase domain-containing protein [Rhodophyticola sp. MJ-SS7]